VKHSYVRAAILVPILLGHRFPVIHLKNEHIVFDFLWLQAAFSGLLARLAGSFSPAVLSFAGCSVLAPAFISSVERTILPLSLNPLLRSCWALALIRSDVTFMPKNPL
jgi:hypothetical protein